MTKPPRSWSIPVAKRRPVTAALGASMQRANRANPTHPETGHPRSVRRPLIALSEHVMPLRESACGQPGRRPVFGSDRSDSRSTLGRVRRSLAMAPPQTHSDHRRPAGRAQFFFFFPHLGGLRSKRSCWRRRSSNRRYPFHQAAVRCSESASRARSEFASVQGYLWRLMRPWDSHASTRLNPSER